MSLNTDSQAGKAEEENSGSFNVEIAFADPRLAVALDSGTRRIPMKTCMFSTLMTIVGFIGIVLGINGLVNHPKKFNWSVLLGMGLLMFVPGSYSSWYLIQTIRGVPGFHFSNLPSYEDVDDPQRN